MALADPRLRQISFTKAANVVSIQFDASMRGPDHAGQVELRLHVPDPDAMTEALDEVGVRVVSG